MTRLKLYGFIIMSVLLALVGQYARGRAAGKRAVIVKNERRLIKTIKKVKKIDEAINDMPPVAKRRKLRDKWTY